MTAARGCLRNRRADVENRYRVARTQIVNSTYTQERAILMHVVYVIFIPHFSIFYGVPTWVLPLRTGQEIFARSPIKRISASTV